jgi:hypothetical protein
MIHFYMQLVEFIAKNVQEKQGVRLGHYLGNEITAKKMPAAPENNPAPNSSKIKSKARLFGQVATVSRRARQMLRPGWLQQIPRCGGVSLGRHRWTAVGPPHYSSWETGAANGDVSGVRAHEKKRELDGNWLHCAIIRQARRLRCVQ